MFQVKKKSERKCFVRLQVKACFLHEFLVNNNIDFDGLPPSEGRNAYIDYINIQHSPGTIFPMKLVIYSETSVTSFSAMFSKCNTYTS